MKLTGYCCYFKPTCHNKLTAIWALQLLPFLTCVNVVGISIIVGLLVNHVDCWQTTCLDQPNTFSRCLLNMSIDNKWTTCLWAARANKIVRDMHVSWTILFTRAAYITCTLNRASLTLKACGFCETCVLLQSLVIVCAYLFFITFEPHYVTAWKLFILLLYAHHVWNVWTLCIRCSHMQRVSTVVMWCWRTV